MAVLEQLKSNDNVTLCNIMKFFNLDCLFVGKRDGYNTYDLP